MPVIADVNSHARMPRLEDGIAGVSRSEVELLPESRSDLRDVVLAVFTEILPIGVDDCSGVEIKAGHLLFIHGNNNHHLVLGRDLLHQLRGWTVGHALGHLVPFLILFGAEVGTVKELLKTENLHLLLRSLFNQFQVFVDHGFLDLSHAVIWAKGIMSLNKAAADNSRHIYLGLGMLKKLNITTLGRLANSTK